MKYALFLGCTIPARSRQYELSARKVAQKLGIELVDVGEFVCCGFPVKASDMKSAMVLGRLQHRPGGKAGPGSVCALQFLHFCAD